MKKDQIVICLGSSCYRRGNQKVLEIVKSWLKEKGLEESTDFRGQLCSGNCAHGPIIKINGKTEHEIGKDSIVHILEQHFAEKLKSMTDE